MAELQLGQQKLWNRWALGFRDTFIKSSLKVFVMAFWPLNTGGLQKLSQRWQGGVFTELVRDYLYMQIVIVYM